MKNIKILPPLEKWDGDNQFLYCYDSMINEHGDEEIMVIKVPHPTPVGVFYKRRIIPNSMINLPQYNNCKFCNRPLIDGYWRRMHVCRGCHIEKRGQNRLFYSNCKKCNNTLTPMDYFV